MRKTRIEIDKEKTCEGIAQAEYRMLQRLNLINEHSLSVVKATFRSKYRDTDADRMCAELDRLYNEPTLF